ncbi:hypothetical protein ACUR5C_00295 [Aliikangiella sp. IMCC44653]
MNRAEVEAGLLASLEGTSLCMAEPNENDGDFKGAFSMFSSEPEKGRTGPVTHGYRPQHETKDGIHTSGAMRFIGQDILWPGECCEVFISLLSPESFDGKSKPGDLIGIYEGSRQIGEVKVLAIYNEVFGKNC